jgi:hypothetical protein
MSLLVSLLDATEICCVSPSRRNRDLLRVTSRRNRDLLRVTSRRNRDLLRVTSRRNRDLLRVTSRRNRDLLGLWHLPKPDHSLRVQNAIHIVPFLFA